MSQQTPEEIQADIERQRERLAGTVDQLTHKLDVKAQAKQRVAGVKDRATTADGSPDPGLVGAAAGAAAGVVLALLIIAWRSRR